MTKINSRQKGARYEREVAKEWTEATGMAAERAARNGVDGGEDVLVDGIHPECKRRKSLAVYKFIDQAVEDARDGKVPVVVMRGDHRESLVMVRLSDLMELARRLPR